MRLRTLSERNVMKTRDEMISSILAYGIKMKTILEEAKIKFSYVQMPEEKGHIPTHCLEEGLAWLIRLHDNQFAACLETKKLVPEDQWEMYRMLDMSGSREMLDLNKNFRDLRKVVISKERPAVFRRKKFNAPKAKRQGASQQKDVQAGNESPARPA